MKTNYASAEVLREVSNTKCEVSFTLIKEALQYTYDNDTDPVNIISSVQDISAILCLGHAYNILSESVESAGSYDIFYAIYDVTNLYASTVSVHTEEESILTLLKAKINIIIQDIQRHQDQCAKLSTI